MYLARPYFVSKIELADQIKQCAKLCLKFDEIAFILNLSESEIEEHRNTILDNWPDEKVFIKKRKARVIRTIGIEECHKLFPEIFMARQNLKNRITSSIKACIRDTFGFVPKNIEPHIGYSVEDLIDHLKTKFSPGMSWDNWGQWHIDHIEPRSRFKKRPIKECYKLSNIQPLWRRENLEKGSKWDDRKQ